MASESQPQTQASTANADVSQTKASGVESFDAQQPKTRRPMRSTAMPAGARQNPARMSAQPPTAGAAIPQLADPWRNTIVCRDRRMLTNQPYGKGPRRGAGPPRNDLGRKGMVATEMTVDNQKYCPVNQLKHIALDKNGTFMTDFDPEKSKREMRKLNRKIHKEKFSKVQNQQFCAQSSTTSLMYAKFNNKRQNQMYDEKGRLLENSKDVCDCLDKDCPGCHFPCPKCSSEKCGVECRVERRWIYEQIEVEGTNLTLKWTLTKLT